MSASPVALATGDADPTGLAAEPLVAEVDTGVSPVVGTGIEQMFGMVLHR